MSTLYTWREMDKNRILLILGLVLCSLATHGQTHAQPELKPYPPDALLNGILDFREPTGLRGRVLYLDKKNQIIWLDWAQISVDRPKFEKSWKLVPNEWIIAVHPLNQSQFYDLQQMAKGTALEIVIQLDQEGLRRILSFQELALLPKIHAKFSTSTMVPAR